MREEAELNLRKAGKEHDNGRESASSHADEPIDIDEEDLNPRPRRSSTLERPYRPAYSESPIEEESKPLPFDFVRLLDALKHKLVLWAGAGLVLGLIGFLGPLLGNKKFVNLQLMRREVPTLFRATEGGDAFKPQVFTENTLISLIQSPEVYKRVAAKSNPRVSAVQIYKTLGVGTVPDSDIINLYLNKIKNPQDGVNLLNLYAEEVVNYTKEIQAREAEEMNTVIDERLAATQRDVAKVNEELEKLSPDAKYFAPDEQTKSIVLQVADLDMKLETARIDLETQDFKLKALERELAVRNPLAERLQNAQNDLDTLLVKYTEIHPSVQDKKAEIAGLEKQIATATNSPNRRITGSAAADGIYVNMVQMQSGKQALAMQIEKLEELRKKKREQLAGLSDRNQSYAVIKGRLQSLENARSMLANRQREAQMFKEKALGYFRVFTPASIDRVASKSPWKKSLAFAVLGAFIGMFGVAGFIVAREILDDTIKSAADLERVTGLPLLGQLGDLSKMSATEQNNWAFRTWTIMKGKLTPSQSHGIVCGFISAQSGEGRSTWIRLLVNTANQRGLRVLTVATQSTPDPAMHPHEPADADTEMSSALAPSVLAFPALVTQQLNDPNNAYPVVHIPLPGWAWNLERRKQWQSALDHWRQIENLVLLVELPPASQAESILLAEKLPQLIWLCDSGKVSMKETREHMETLRHAGCNLVGTVLNHEPKSFWRNQYSRWFAWAILLIGLNFSNAQAAETNDAPVAVNRSFSVKPSQRAEWQKNLTLGPGDVLNLGFYGETNLNKVDVAIGPDGRINYLQATGVMAAGLTVDELRKKLDQELSNFYRTPRTTIQPVVFNSKKYFVLGKVMNRGVFVLDRPLTVVEALARAKGLEMGMLDRNSIDFADLQRSFLVRNGKRMPVDFEKLFQEGDLSQNIPIEPNDYLYFPSSALREVYVVGEVRIPGVTTHTGSTSLIGAISDRGGFTDRAYKSHVIVIRGSLNKPETTVVDTMAVLDGRAPDFKLKPKDIVYVAARPFIRAEELLDLAAMAFIQGAVTAWTGEYIGPLVKKPFIPGPP